MKILVPLLVVFIGFAFFLVASSCQFQSSGDNNYIGRLSYLLLSNNSVCTIPVVNEFELNLDEK